MSKKISLFSLVLLIVAAIDSIRNLPAAALFGSALPFFFLFAALIFLFPVSLISAEFASRFPEEGGVFPWVRHAFGGKTALLAVWLQWINTMVWYPTILSFIAGTLAYLFDPSLATNKGFILCTILVVFWGMTFLNFFGLHVSTKVNSVSVLIGTLIPMGVLIGLAVIWVGLKKPIAISFSPSQLLPSLKHPENWISLVAIMASYLGMELSGVHVNEIKDPKINFPKALGISVVILLVTMLLGALSIAMVIPDHKIRLVDGIMQTFTEFFAAFHLTFLVKVLAFLILIGSIGGMINWLLSPAKGLLQAAEFGFFPRVFLKKNEKGVATRILWIQAIIVSIICLLLTLMPSLNAFYWFLTALSTNLYTWMYVILFLSALKLKRPKREEMAYQIPKGFRKGVCFIGLLGCGLALLVSFFPPPELQVSTTRYALWMLGGSIFLISPLLFIKKSEGRK